ncbi:hypothetical protein JYA64_00095, partial [Fictibacillus barbaricus]|nr:hypothetical protein [Fictibacillus barbaricus]
DKDSNNIDINQMTKTLYKIKNVDWSAEGSMKYLKGITGSRTLAKELEMIANDIQKDLLPYVAGPLKDDTENAVAKIESSLKSKSVEPLKGVHRIFHDLDITLNGYKQATDYWEVT